MLQKKIERDTANLAYLANVDVLDNVQCCIEIFDFLFFLHYGGGRLKR